MKIRNVLGLAVTVVTLGTLGIPGAAAAPGTVSFAGTFQATPGAIQQPAFCFTALASCPNELASTGVAAGSSTDPLAIDGLYIELSNPDACLLDLVVSPVTTARMTIQVHDLNRNAWVAKDPAVWTHAGGVVVFTGDASGTAQITPLGVPACGVPITYAIEGDLSFVA